MAIQLCRVSKLQNSRFLNSKQNLNSALSSVGGEKGKDKKYNSRLIPGKNGSTPATGLTEYGPFIKAHRKYAPVLGSEDWGKGGRKSWKICEKKVIRTSGKKRKASFCTVGMRKRDRRGDELAWRRGAIHQISGRLGPPGYLRCGLDPDEPRRPLWAETTALLLWVSQVQQHFHRKCLVSSHFLCRDWDHNLLLCLSILLWLLWLICGLNNDQTIWWKIQKCAPQILCGKRQNINH